MDRRQCLRVIKYNNLKRWIAPIKIENIYIQSIYVGQCYVDIDIEQVRFLFSIHKRDKSKNKFIQSKQTTKKGLFNSCNRTGY